MSSINVCVTIIAGSTGIAPGMASASGSTTNEFRVAELNATARPAGGFRLNNRLMPQPTSGAMMAKSKYMGITLSTASIAGPNCGKTAAMTTNRTVAVAGIGSRLRPAKIF